jgi:hypothetical protein
MKPEREGKGRDWRHRLAAAVVTVGMAVGIALLSLQSLPGGEVSDGVLLLDWRLRGEETGSCLQAPEADLERLPVHMRGQDACLGRLPPYRLVLEIDGSVILDREVTGGGLRGDRPLTVYREIRVEPGRREIHARFFREDGDPAAVELEVRETVDVEAGRVLLLVRRQDTGTMEVRAPSG